MRNCTLLKEYSYLKISIVYDLLVRPSLHNHSKVVGVNISPKQKLFQCALMSLLDLHASLRIKVSPSTTDEVKVIGF